MYIAISYPETYDTGIMRFDTLEEALEWYEEVKSYGADPILTKVIDVKLTVDKSK